MKASKYLELFKKREDRGECFTQDPDAPLVALILFENHKNDSEFGEILSWIGVQGLATLLDIGGLPIKSIFRKAGTVNLVTHGVVSFEDLRLHHIIDSESKEFIRAMLGYFEELLNKKIDQGL